MPTILVIGATGNIGVAAIIAARRSGYDVLALVRDQGAAERLSSHVGDKEGITVVEADILDARGVQGVVERVEKGDLPGFAHVWSCVGRWLPTPLHAIKPEEFRRAMDVNFAANFFAYRATIPYLLAQNDPSSTWTQCTGASADWGAGGVTGASQGALFAMLKVAARENERSNVRVNEVYLSMQVAYDSVAEQMGDHVVKSSDFGRVYEAILARPEVRGCRVLVTEKGDLEELRFAKFDFATWTP